MKKLFYLFLMLVFFSQCEKWDLEEIVFLKSTIEEININAAVVTSEVSGIKSEVVVQHGHVWSFSLEEPTVQLNDGMDSKGGMDADGSFSTPFEDLDVDTIYYVRAFAEINDRVLYGNTVVISTGNIRVFTDSLVYIDANEAQLYGSLSGLGSGITADQYGFCWSYTNDAPTIGNDNFLSLGIPSVDGAFSGNINSLINDELYYYRSYVITNFGAEIIYGEVGTWNSTLTNVWEEKQALPVFGVYFRGFEYDGHGFVFAANKVYRYDHLNDSWDELTTKPGGLFVESVVFVIDDYVYFMLGTPDFNSQLSSECWRLELSSGNWDWEQLDDFPGPARVSPIGFSMDGKGYLGMGVQLANVSLNDFWKYDPVNDEWTELDSYPREGWAQMISFVAGGKGYIGGGGGFDPINLFAYDTQTEEWIQKNTLPGGNTSKAVSFVVNGKAYLGTGDTGGSNFSNLFWSYDHVSDVWTEITELAGQPRVGPYGFSVGDKGYVGSGVNLSGWQDDFWEYTPKID